MTSKLQPIQFSDCTGGLNTNDPASELDLTTSPDLDNILLMNKGFKKRTGDSAFCSAMNSGKNVQMLAYYKEKGNNEFLVAIAGNKVYKSDSLDGTMDEITGAGGSTAPTDGQNNIYTPVILKNLLIWFGPSAPQSWDGSTATNTYQTLAGSPPTADLAFVMKDRVFAGKTTADPSTLWWPVLANPEDWTGTGSGNTTFETNDGDKLMAGMPLNNDLALIFKQYSIHHLIVQTAPFPTKPLLKAGIGCCGKNALCNIGGQIVFVSMEPRVYITDGYTVRPLDPKGRIDDIWDGISKSRLQYIQVVNDPVNDLIHFVLSNTTSASNNYDIIWDIKRECWLRNTAGWDSNVLCVAQGYRIFGGHTNGIIYEKYKSGTYADASETAPGGIDAYRYSPWIKGQTNDSIVHPYSLTINHKTQTTGNISVSYGFNYNQDTNSYNFSQLQVGGKWGESTWNDSFVWGGQSDSQTYYKLYGRGNNFQVKIYNNVAGQPMQINSYSMRYKEAGFKEIKNV